jgi:AcrR family transcriptional regulator
MDKETRKKIEIAEKATERYLKNRRFTIQSLAEEAGVTSKDVFEFFPNRRSILQFYYESRILLYQEQKNSIDSYSDFSLREKLSNLFLTMLDLFDEQREFVLETYKEFVVTNPMDKRFENSFRDDVKHIFQSDNQVSFSSRFLLNQITYAIFYYHFHALILFWSKDASRGREQTYALVDKWCSFVEEFFYSKIADKGFDLAKFLFYHSPLKGIIPDLKK